MVVFYPVVYTYDIDNKQQVNGMVKINKKGFSLVEVSVVVAVLAVLIAVVAPALLRHVEDSRSQKDESAMDEVVNSVQLALSEAEIFDEMLRYSASNNYMTYTDSSGVYGAQYADEEYWAPDGSGKTTTITFVPSDGQYYLKDALVNDMYSANPVVAETRTFTGTHMENISCALVDVKLDDGATESKMYTKLRSVLGDTVTLGSNTYGNSSYTVFMHYQQKDGMPFVDVYGMWNGTNLDESSSVSPGNGVEEDDDELNNSEGLPETPPTEPTPPLVDDDDLQGGGSMTPADPEPISTTRILSKIKLGVFVQQNSPSKIEFVINGNTTGTDISESQDGSVVAYMNGTTCVVTAIEPNAKVKAPQDSSRLFDGEAYPAYKYVSELSVGNLDVSNATNLNYAFQHLGYELYHSTVKINGLESWDVSKVRTMEWTFYRVGTNADTVTMDISNWNVSNVKSFDYFLHSCGYYSKNWSVGLLNDWDVSNCEDFSGMFYWAGGGAEYYNVGNLNNWDVSNAREMDYMFTAAGMFSTYWNIGNLTNWEMPYVTSFEGMFEEAGRHANVWYVGDLGAWDVSNVTNFYHMFYYASTATNFNPGNIVNWDTSSATNMTGMFYMVNTNRTFNLNGWNVNNVSQHTEFSTDTGIKAPIWKR